MNQQAKWQEAVQREADTFQNGIEFDAARGWDSSRSIWDYQDPAEISHAAVASREALTDYTGNIAAFHNRMEAKGAAHNGGEASAWATFKAYSHTFVDGVGSLYNAASQGISDYSANLTQRSAFTGESEWTLLGTDLLKGTFRLGAGMIEGGGEVVLVATDTARTGLHLGVNAFGVNIGSMDPWSHTFNGGISEYPLFGRALNNFSMGAGHFGNGDYVNATIGGAWGLGEGILTVGMPVSGKLLNAARNASKGVVAGTTYLSNRVKNVPFFTRAEASESRLFAINETISASSPSEIAWGYGDLSKRQQNILDQLPDTMSMAKLHKKNINVTDLAAMTARTGDEFALFTNGSQRLIVRGNARGVSMTHKELLELHQQGYKWSAHSHPGTSDFVLDASGIPGDRMVLDIFKQEQSLILNSAGKRNLFNMYDNFRID